MSIHDRILKDFAPNLATDREKIPIDELIEFYPHGVHVTGLDYLPSANKGDPPYPIFTFAEDDTKYFCGSGDVPKLAKSIMDEADDDLWAAKESLAAKPMLIRIRKTPMKGGKQYTKVEALRE